jgi:hypothetical protein
MDHLEGMQSFNPTRFNNQRSGQKFSVYERNQPEALIIMDVTRDRTCQQKSQTEVLQRLTECRC